MPVFGGVNADIGNFGNDFGPLRRRPTPGAKVERTSADIVCYGVAICVEIYDRLLDKVIKRVPDSRDAVGERPRETKSITELLSS